MAGEDELKEGFKISSLGTITSTTSSSGLVYYFGIPPARTGAPVSELETLEYEAGMLQRALQILANEAQRLDELFLKNAITEIAVLHARSLCSVFIEYKPRKDDIRLSRLFPDWDAETNGKYAEIEKARSRLKAAYGDHNDPNSHHFAFNKLVMHATTHRGAYGLYDQAFADLMPIIEEIIRHIECLKSYTFKPIE
jgi:hypothetical protein